MIKLTNIDFANVLNTEIAEAEVGLLFVEEASYEFVGGGQAANNL